MMKFEYFLTFSLKINGLTTLLPYTLSDDCADELGSDDELLDARNEWLVVLTWLADGLHHLAHDVEAALTSLLPYIWPFALALYIAI